MSASARIHTDIFYLLPTSAAANRRISATTQTDLFLFIQFMGDGLDKRWCGRSVSIQKSNRIFISNGADHRQRT